ncbi:MAG TPA: DUF2235 domain-containing protein, partial [Agromyces sp.]
MKNIVMCFDGTGAQVRATRNSNVVLLYSMLDLSDPAKQIAYYDPGLGTQAATGAWSPAARALSKLFGLAFGTGIRRNLGEAYLWLANNWVPGDRIYLFGFSRGAYTARALAGMLRNDGLVRPGSENLVEYVVATYTRRHDDRRARPAAAADDAQEAAFWGDAHKTAELFGRPVDDEGRTTPPIAYLGLWDTVKSVGMLRWEVHWRDTNKLGMADHVRHALSIHEWRRPFLPAPVTPDPDAQRPRLEEMWFAGVHTDVGGGFADDRLSRISLKWVVDGAIDDGIRLAARGRNRYERSCRVEVGDVQGGVGAMSGWWRLLGVAHRRVPASAVVHESVRLRRDGGGRDLPEFGPGVTWGDTDWLTPREIAAPEAPKAPKAVDAAGALTTPGS